MKNTAILPAGHRAVSLEALDRLDATASKTIGLLGLLSAFARSEKLSHELSIEQEQGIDRLACDLGAELEAAVEALSPMLSNPDQEAE